MANPNDEPLRARGRPATPETALRATLAQATLALLLDRRLCRGNGGCGGETRRGG